jgi:predicted metalloprotease
LTIVRGAALLALIVALSASACGETESTKRTLDSPRSVPGLRDQPRDPTLNVRVLVRTQFRDAINVFRSWDKSFEEPVLLLLDTDSSSGGYSRACHSELKPGDAFYCPREHKIYLDLGWLEDFSRRSVNGALRDGAVFSTVAHELGHGWYAHVGFIDRDPNTIVDEELFADCIAGAVIAATYEDPEAAVPLIQQAAEDAYSVGSYDWQNPDFHGTPRQRRDATLLGSIDGHRSCEQYVS